MKWIKNSAGNEDAMLTLGVISLGVVLLKFFLSDMSFGPVTFGNLDGGVILAILGSTLGAYVSRRYTDAKFQVTDEPKKEETNVEQ